MRELKKFVNSFEWYQSFDLPNFKVKGRFPTHFDLKNPSVMPQDLKGKTWLDVACNTGLFCIEAARRGAKRVVGIEPDKTWLKRAKKLASFLGLGKIEYYPLSALEIGKLGSFDFVSCFSLIHLNEVRQPFQILQELKKATKEVFITEVHTWELKFKINRFPWRVVLRHPLVTTRGVARILKKDIGWKEVEYLGKSAKNRDLFRCLK